MASRRVNQFIIHCNGIDCVGGGIRTRQGKSAAGNLSVIPAGVLPRIVDTPYAGAMIVQGTTKCGNQK